MRNIIKSAFGGKMFLAILGGILLTFAFVATAKAAPNWDVTGSWNFDLNSVVWGGSYSKTMTITQDLSGNITGTGNNFPAGNTWSVTGNVSGDVINFALNYDAPMAGYVASFVGNIQSDGSMNGTWSDVWYSDSGLWYSTSGTAVLVNNDSDGDGVENNEDYCSRTTTEGSWDVSWGTNRWQYYDGSSGLGWYQNKPAGKGEYKPTKLHEISYTCGCNGHQILNHLSPLGDTMLGHWKYGLSSSVVDEFSLDCQDGTIDGRYLIDEVDVSGKGNLINSHFASTLDVPYYFEASGTYVYGTGWGIDAYGDPYGIADAEYSNRPAWTFGPGWILGDDIFPGAGYPAYALDLMVNGGNVDWGTYTSTHKYNTEINGTGVPFTFNIWDNNYGDNSGSLHVKIFADL